MKKADRFDLERWPLESLERAAAEILAYAESTEESWGELINCDPRNLRWMLRLRSLLGIPIPPILLGFGDPPPPIEEDDDD